MTTIGDREPDSSRTIRVRRARSDDPADVAFLGAQAPRVAAGAPAWRDAATIGAIAQGTIADVLHARREEEVVLLAEDAAGRRLGFVYALATIDPLSRESQGHVSDIVVMPEAEGRGVGHRLLAAAEGWAAARGATGVTVHVFPANARARRLYERQGYALEWLRLRKPV